MFLRTTLGIIPKLLQRRSVIISTCIVLFFVVVALLSSWIVPYDLMDSDLSKRLMPPSWKHPFGCDLNGLDVLSSMIYGARTSLFIGFMTVTLSLTIGVVIGLMSGFIGGMFDNIVMRIVDMLMAFPALLVAMLMAATLGQSATTIIFAISATGWISAARLVRGEVLKYREMTYVTASKALGARSSRLMWVHIFPSTISSLIVHATFSLSGVIIIESGLSFLGLGTLEGYPSWGALLSQGQTVIAEAPHLSIAPGLAIMIIVLSLNFMGDGLRDILDPKTLS